MSTYFNVVSYGILMKSHIRVKRKFIKGDLSISTQLTKRFLRVHSLIDPGNVV